MNFIYKMCGSITNITEKDSGLLCGRVHLRKGFSLYNPEF